MPSAVSALPRRAFDSRHPGYGPNLVVPEPGYLGKIGPTDHVDGQSGTVVTFRDLHLEHRRRRATIGTGYARPNSATINPMGTTTWCWHPLHQHRMPMFCLARSANVAGRSMVTTLDPKWEHTRNKLPAWSLFAGRW